MPGCVLRTRGSECPLPIELVTSKTKSGFIFSVGVAEGDDFKAQVTEATAFLAQHSAALQKASSSPGFSAELDFGVWNGAPEVISQSFVFPLPLLALASQCGVELELSVYLASDP